MPPLAYQIFALSFALLATLKGQGWDEKFANAFSSRISEIDSEIENLGNDLVGLPVIPLDDRGGTSGCAVLYTQPTGDHAITMRWDEPAMIDFVALVPARRYGVSGLESQYGTPNSFRVILINADGEEIADIGSESNIHQHPIRRGHPFVYEIDDPVEASGMMIIAPDLLKYTDQYVHAWAEVFVFSGNRNVAMSATINTDGGMRPAAGWEWSPDYLIDGQTPLGLPEMPVTDHRNVGWLSEGRANADDSTWLEIDFGEVRSFESIRLMPVQRPTSDLPSGFGFPERLTIRISDERSSALGEIIHEESFANPGYNPVEISIPESKTRYLYLEATKLWKPYESYPAFFALSEVEVFNDGENVALHAAVRSPHGMNNVIASGSRMWNTISLTDGFGPDGKLVSYREWFGAIDKRLQLETRRFELRAERADNIAVYRRLGIGGIAVIAVIGAIAMIALPLRYRVRSKQDLRKVRERIAGDLHDEVGSNLGSIQMFADLAESRSGESKELKRIQRIAAETVSAVRDIVWLLRPHGGARIGTAEHMRETASIMLEPVEWEFSGNELAWQVELEDEASRDLFLFFREALHNILRHAKASKVVIRVEENHGRFLLKISDDGCGIPDAKKDRPSTLRALRQRAEALKADFAVDSEEGKGTTLELNVPLCKRRPKAPVAGVAT